MALRDKIADLF